MRPTPLATLAAIAALGLLVAACADRVLGPSRTPPGRFTIDATQRSELVAAIRFAMGDRSMSALADRSSVAPIADALDDLAIQIERNDRSGAHRSIDAARLAVHRYRETSPSDVMGALLLETVSLTLDHVTLLAGPVGSGSLYRADEGS